MWEAILMSHLSSVENTEEILPQSLDPMGSREEIISRLKSTFGSIKMVGTNKMLVRGGDFDVHFDIGDSDPARMIRVSTNGEIYLVLELLYEKYKWKTFDLQVRDFIEMDRAKPEEKGKHTEEQDSVQESPVSSTGMAAVGEIAGNWMGAFIKYFLVVSAALVLEAAARPHIGGSLAKGVFSTVISLFNLYVLYRFGRDNRFVKKRHALAMSVSVSLLLMGLNFVQNWQVALAIQDSEVIKALSFAFVLKTAIYYLFAFMGIKIRLTKEEGGQTLEFRWR